jgi:hypothetical protein
LVLLSANFKLTSTDEPRAALAEKWSWRIWILDRKNMSIANVEDNSLSLWHAFRLAAMLSQSSTDEIETAIVCDQSLLKIYWQKTSQFTASCKDSRMLQESLTYKTA